MEPIDFSNSAFNAAMIDIEHHWKATRATAKKLDKRELTVAMPWFGDLVSWIKLLDDIHYSADLPFDLSFKRIYPASIQSEESMRDIARELDLLLPEDSESVRAILPILISGYIVNRRACQKTQENKLRNYRNRQDNNRKSKAGVKRCYEGTPALYTLLLDDDENSEQFRKFIKRKEGLFKLTDYLGRYPKLKYSELTSGKIQMILSGFGIARLFLFLLYKTQDICDVSLSYLVFMVMTRYPQLLSSAYPWFESEAEFLDRARTDEIIQFIKKELSDVFVFHQISSSPTKFCEGDDATPIFDVGHPMPMYEYIHRFTNAIKDRQVDNIQKELKRTDITNVECKRLETELNTIKSKKYPLLSELDMVFRDTSEDGCPLSNYPDLENLLEESEFTFDGYNDGK